MSEWVEHARPSWGIGTALGPLVPAGRTLLQRDTSLAARQDHLKDVQGPVARGADHDLQAHCLGLDDRCV